MKLANTGKIRDKSFGIMISNILSKPIIQLTLNNEFIKEWKSANEVERELRVADSVEVESKKIGQMVSARLKKIDKIAYIRFSSVFKRFVDIEDFEKEVKKLIK